MSVMRRFGSFGCALLLVVGCTTAPAPVEDRGPAAPARKVVPAQPPESVLSPLPDSGPVEIQAIPEIGPIAEPLPPAGTDGAPEPARATSPAVVALLDTAGQQSRSGNQDRAAATLERAIQIEPRNAALWHQLAMVRLEQGRHDQAASLAAKSNTLAGRDFQLKAKNWRLIAQVKERQGDRDGANRAASEAARLSGLP